MKKRAFETFFNSKKRICVARYLDKKLSAKGYGKSETEAITNALETFEYFNSLQKKYGFKAIKDLEKSLVQRKQVMTREEFEKLLETNKR